MYFKVRITKGLPQAKTGGFTGNNLNKQVISFGGADMNAASRHLENTRYLKQVPRDEANLEAEKGETAFGDINGDGFTEHMLIGGKRHSQGGTPLNLPDGTFIFSDTASMKIKDPEILAKFGKKKGSYTPAELAKPYDLNKYRKILEDPNSDKIDKKSAELMIKNINLKLGALALAQESKKGFPQGIPEVARPYMEEMGIREEDLIPQQPQPEAQVNQQAMQNPYEAQGMQMQSPQEEMMEQGPGMQNPQEEMMEAPMGRYGFQMGRRLRRAQEGMEQGAPQQGNPLEQLIQMVQQMLQQGAEPAEVVMQLLQKQVPPQAIMQVLVEVGMPQEQAQATIQEVMQQGQQNPEEEIAEGPQGQSSQEEMMEAPMAQYGMSMGGYGMPFHDTQYRTGGTLTRYQKKGEVDEKNSVIINRADYKTDEDYALARNEMFAKAGNKPVYVVMPDGKYKKITQKTKATDPYTGEDLKTTWNNSAEIATLFRSMNKSINTPEFTKILGKYTKDAIKNPAKYKGSNQKTSKVYDTEFSKKDYKDEEIRDAFAKHQKRNLALQAHGIKARYFENVPTGRLLTPEKMVAKKVLTDAGKPITLAEAKQIYNKYQTSGITDLNKAFTKVGIPLDNTALEQATFQGFTDAIKNKANLTPEEQKALTNWAAYETGVADETGQENNKISPIDNVYTNTSGEQLSAYDPTELEYVESDLESKPDDATNAVDTENEDYEMPYVPEVAPWKQDKLNLLNAGIDYLGANKYLPWAAPYMPELMDPVYYDPTRELAQQSEQANIANQALAQFVGPQALSARSASIQGEGAKQAADTLARYNNLNVGTANTFEGNNTQVMNEAQKYNQALAKQLYDQNVVANQSYDNTKRALRHNLADAQNTLTTNMWKTDALNQLFPQYAVDPSVGGRMHFTKNKTITPELTSSYDSYLEKYMGAPYYMEPEAAQKAARDAIKYSNPNSEDNRAEALQLMYGKKGGSMNMAYVMGSNVFPFMFY